jgi:hypothetical protein
VWRYLLSSSSVWGRDIVHCWCWSILTVRTTCATCRLVTSTAPGMRHGSRTTCWVACMAGAATNRKGPETQGTPCEAQTNLTEDTHLVVPRKDAFWDRYRAFRQGAEDRIDLLSIMVDRQHIFVVSGSVAIPKYGGSVLRLTEVCWCCFRLISIFCHWLKFCPTVRMEFQRSQAHVSMLKPPDRRSTYKCWAFVRTPWMCPLHWGLWAGYWGGWGLAYMAGTTWGKLSFKPWDGIGMNWVILHPFWDVLKWGFPKIRVPQNHPKLDHGFGLPPFSETSKYCCKESSRLATCVCF